MTAISHMIYCQIFGLTAGGHHLCNVLLHISAVILLFEFLRTTTAAPWASAVAAMIFAVHPLRVESVAWISERKDVLSGVFFMLTLLAYRKYARDRSWWRMTMVATCLSLGLMSKPMLVTTPLVLVLLHYSLLHRNASLASLLIVTIPIFTRSAASASA